MAEATYRMTGTSDRKIDTWRLISPFKQDGVEEVEVRLVTDRKSGRRFFRAISKGQRNAENEPLVWSHESIDSLHKVVERELSEYMSAKIGIVWEDMICIVVHSTDGPSYKTRGDGSAKGLSFEYGYMKRGTHPSNPDVAYTVYKNGAIVKFPSPKSAGELDPDTPRGDNVHWSKQLGERNVDDAYSYIKDTPEHRAAIESVRMAIDKLKDRLADVVRQSSVHDFLSSVNTGVAALPSPDHNGG